MALVEKFVFAEHVAADNVVPVYFNNLVDETERCLLGDHFQDLLNLPLSNIKASIDVDYGTVM